MGLIHSFIPVCSLYCIQQGLPARTFSQRCYSRIFFQYYLACRFFMDIRKNTEKEIVIINYHQTAVFLPLIF